MICIESPRFLANILKPWVATFLLSFRIKTCISCAVSQDTVKNTHLHTANIDYLHVLKLR